MNRNLPAESAPLPEQGRVRAVIDAVLPHVDGGRFAAKCIAGEPFEVRAHCFTDGHDLVRVMLQWAPDDADDVTEVEMVATGNDEWRACFVPATPGRYRYRVAAWVDGLRSWRHELSRRIEAEDIRVAALTGAALIAEAARRATQRDDAERLDAWATRLRTQAADPAADAVALKAMALEGHGLAFLPGSSVERDMRASRLVRASTPGTCERTSTMRYGFSVPVTVTPAGKSLFTAAVTFWRSVSGAPGLPTSCSWRSVISPICFRCCWASRPGRCFARGTSLGHGTAGCFPGG